MTAGAAGAGRLVRLPAAGFRRTPWKNGGGVTIDIADEYRPGAEPGAWSGMVWRFGRTRIEAPGPFSDLSGYDRILAVIGGRGLVLRVGDGHAIDVREPFRPVRFRGEDPIRSELEDGPVAVLNLIGNREAVALDMRFVGAGEGATLTSSTCVLYAPDERVVARLDGEPVDIPAGDAARVEVASALQVEVERGIVALAIVGPCVR